jgi:MFS family permease
LRWIILTFFLGAVGLVAGLFFFGQIDGEKITWSREGLAGKVWWGGAGDLIGGQPVLVWGTLGVGLAAGVVLAIVAGKRRRKKAVSKVMNDKSDSAEASDVQQASSPGDSVEAVEEGQQAQSPVAQTPAPVEPVGEVDAGTQKAKNKKRWFVVVILLMMIVGMIVAFIPFAMKGVEKLRRDNPDFSWASKTMVSIYFTLAVLFLFTVAFAVKKYFKDKSNPKHLAYVLCFALLAMAGLWTWSAVGAMQGAADFSWRSTKAIALYFASGIFCFGIIAFMGLMRRATTRWDMEARLGARHKAKAISHWLVIFNWTRKILHIPTIVFAFLAAFIMWLYSDSENIESIGSIVGAIWFCVWLFCHTIEDNNISLSVAIALFGGLLLFTVLAIFGEVDDEIIGAVQTIRIFASPALYLGFGLAYLTSIGLSYVKGLFYYVAIEPNQMIVQFKIGEDGETFQRMQYDARVEATVDIFEWFFYDTATIKIQFHGGKRSPMEYYVGRIKRKAEWLSAVLGVTAVE